MFIRSIIDRLVDFWIEKKRYLIAVLLFIAFGILLAFGTGSYSVERRAGKGDTESETDDFSGFTLQESFQKDTADGVNALIGNYFSAYASDDLDALAEMAYPLSDNEKSYISIVSRYIESYDNIRCYTKNGPTEGSYLVSVYYELKFYEVETAAPGVDFFYVETDPEGGLYINNLYSPYNFSRQENEWDANIYSVILQYEQQEDVISLLSGVQQQYNDAVSGDMELAAMITTTIPMAMGEWLESIRESDQPEQEEGDTEPDTQETEDTGGENQEEPKQQGDSGDGDEQPEKEEPAENQTITVRTTDNVFVRASATKDSEAYEKALKGSTFQKIGTEGDWTQIEYKGGVAYIKSEYLEEVNE